MLGWSHAGFPRTWTARPARSASNCSARNWSTARSLPPPIWLIGELSSGLLERFRCRWFECAFPCACRRAVRFAPAHGPAYGNWITVHEPAAHFAFIKTTSNPFGQVGRAAVVSRCSDLSRFAAFPNRSLAATLRCRSSTYAFSLFDVALRRTFFHLECCRVPLP
jgi:hypothetical protein